MTYARFSFDGQVALITGSTRGIGRAIAEQFLEAGARVVVNGRTETSVEKTVSALAGPDREIIGVAADVRELDDVQTLLDRTTAAFGTPDILVNNAGVSHSHEFTDITVDDWERAMENNLTSTYNCCKIIGEAMFETGETIINMSSRAALDAAPYVSDYAAAKSGVISLTKSLANEFATEGIRVNCIAPDFILTDGLASDFEVQTDEISRKETDRRIGLVEEIADIAQFLATEASSYINGQVIVARGKPPAPGLPNALSEGQ